MVKLRAAKYCNLKIFLLYLVVYGHWIEPQIGDTSAAALQYKWIYLIHMPLFSFLSGLFIKNCRTAERQIKRMLPLYLCLQTAAVVIGAGEVKPLTPWWHLWYLLSYCCWAGAAWWYFRFGRGRGQYIILAVSVVVGCAIGYVPAIGRTMSLSRTLCFFPYFWAGVITDPRTRWRKLRPCGIAALIAAVALGVPFVNSVSASFLYHAAPYANTENGALLRLSSYIISGALCLFLLSAVPDRRYPFTKAGADTMPAYLLHAPIVLLVRGRGLPIAIAAVGSAFFLYAVYKLLLWRSTMYGIITCEGRESAWQASRMSIKNTKNRSIGSYSP